MSQPTPYTPTTDFSQQESINASGRSTVNTAALDAELANIETTLDQTLANLTLLQRDDGRLKDVSVELHTLSPEVLNLLGGFNLRELWATATVYAINDIVSKGEYTYLCRTPHTSGASFSTQYWIRFGFSGGADAAQAAAAAQVSASSAGISASAAAVSATSASNSAASISGAVSQAAGHAGTATTKASEAAASATGAANSANAAAASAATVDTSTFAAKNGANATGIWPVSISGNAGTATTAAVCSGRSAIATNADYATNAGYAATAGTCSGTAAYSNNSGALQGYVPGNFAAAGHTHSYAGLNAIVSVSVGLVGDGNGGLLAVVSIVRANGATS